MHVLVLPSWYPTREAPEQGIYFADQVRALRRAGVRTGVVYPEHRSLRGASLAALRRHHFQDTFTCEKGVPTVRRHSWNLCWRLRLGARWRTRQAVALAHRYTRRLGRPDVIHAHSARWAAAAAARLSRQWHVPYVVTEHFSGFQRGAAFGWEVRLARRSLHGARRVAAVSSSLKRYLLDEGLAPAVQVLPNLAAPFFFAPPSRQSGGAASSEQPFRFFTLGELVRHKGHHVLLEALARGVGGASGVRLEIGGAGPERGALERQAVRLGIGRRVRFLGRLSRPAVRRALWRADAFVLPSFLETFGVVLIEAMATGLPVVATRCGGPEDIVSPQTGRLVPPGDASALAGALNEVIQRRDFFQTSAIRTYTKRRFGAETITRRLLHFYRAALGGT